MNGLGRFWRLFSIDLRSLALFRIGMATIFLFDLAVLRFPDIEAFYADSGMFPVADGRSWLSDSGRWSLCLIDGSPEFQTFMLALSAVFAVALLVGFQTRLATIGCWVMAVSIANRNLLVCNYGDRILDLYLFWGMFLPLGGTWSIDAWRRHSAGVAVEHALQLEYARRSAPIDLLPFKTLLRTSTVATLMLELLGPLVVWIPWRTQWFRYAMIVAFVTLHLSIEVFFTPVLLSYTCMVAWLLFLPGSFWDSRLVRRLTGATKPQESAAPIALDERPGRFVQWGRRLASGFCVLLFMFVVVWNIWTLNPKKYGYLVPEQIRWIGHVTMMDQTWDMFDRPSRHNGWFKARARLADQQVVDVLRHGEPFERDALASNWSYYRSSRWKLFFCRLGIWKETEPLHQGVAEYLLREWNEHRPEDEHAVELSLLYYERLGTSLGAGFTSRQIASVNTGEEPEWELMLQRMGGGLANGLLD